MKCLGMDLGTKTLGLATSDKLGVIASPYKTIKYNNLQELVSEVKEIIENLHIEKLVLGFPKNMNNSLGFAVERTVNFKELLEKETNMSVVLIDERLSTVEAENILISSDMRRENRKKVIDAVAASIILDENGEEKEFYKLFTFDSDETGKSYIVYTDNSTDEKGNVIIRANTYDPSGEDLSLKPLTDDKEWKVIENILISTQEQLREEMAKEGSNNEEDGNTSN